VLCDALSVALEVPFVPHSVSTYGDLLAGLHWGEIQLAWLPPMIALRAVLRKSAIPIAAPIRAGSAWYWTALFTREDSHIQRVEDLDRASVAWVDHMSSAGYLVIRAALRADEVSLERAFGEEQFVGTHDAVVSAVMGGRAQVGATYAHFDDAGRIRNAGWGKQRVRVLKYAGPIPSDVLAASSHLDPALTLQVGETLTLEGHSDVKRAAMELLDATGFAAVDRSHLTHLEDLLAYVEVSVPAR
jgi:phosphonate transport system substrate-binding protein